MMILPMMKNRKVLKNNKTKRVHITHRKRISQMVSRQLERKKKDLNFLVNIRIRMGLWIMKRELVLLMKVMIKPQLLKLGLR
jgi:hypothetical protein